MEHTESQRASFKDDYARRFRKQLIMMGALFAVMATLAITQDRTTLFGLPAGSLGPIVLIIAVVTWAIFSTRTWRCPACDKNLGRAFNPKHCRTCGIELRG